MAERAFVHENIERAGKRHSAMSIQCRNCGAKAYFLQGGGRRLPSIAASQHFRNQGWLVGNGPRMDTCPECRDRKRKPDLKVVEKVSPAKADEPREMTRADRRIINDKLDEVYDENAYVVPWTDASVARDLGVPVAWVAQVRDEFFGPAGSNPEFDDFMEKAAPVISDMRNLFAALHGQVEKVEAMRPRIEALEKMAKRIEKEVGR